MAAPCSDPQPFPVLIGPTAGGKSALAVELSLLLNPRSLPGPVITMDAVQVYRGLDIGSAKPTPAERRGVEHLCIDLADPTESFSVDSWLSHASLAVDSAHAAGARPVVAGGTHLYAKAFLEGLFDGPPADLALRAELECLSLVARRAELVRIDPASAARIHPNDARRTVRALEVYRLTGTPISVQQSQWDKGSRRRGAVVVGLLWPAEEINTRINARVRAMFAAGLVEEVHGLWSTRGLGAQAGQALGYKQLVSHFEGRCSLAQAAEQTKIQTRRFAKQQRTWLRRLLAPHPNTASPPALVLAPEPGEPTDAMLARWSQRVFSSLQGR